MRFHEQKAKFDQERQQADAERDAMQSRDKTYGPNLRLAER